MQFDCDCYFGCWVIMFGKIVRICQTCCSIDDGNDVARSGCGCLECASNARAAFTGYFEKRKLADTEGEPSFIERLFQHVFNGATQDEVSFRFTCAGLA